MKHSLPVAHHSIQLYNTNTSYSYKHAPLGPTTITALFIIFVQILEKKNPFNTHLFRFLMLRLMIFHYGSIFFFCCLEKRSS